MPKEKTKRMSADNPIHPKSRAAGYQTRRISHDQKVVKRSKETSQKMEMLGEKLKWFQDHTDDSKLGYTKPEVCRLVETYFERFAEELDQIQLLNSMKGRSDQHVSRHDSIRITLERERREYEVSGFEVPDLMNTKNYQTFHKWGGELRFIQNLKLKKIKKSDGETQSEKTDKDSAHEDTSSNNEDEKNTT